MASIPFVANLFQYPTPNVFFSKWHLIKGVFHCNLICINLRLNMCVLVYMLHRFVAAYLCSHIHSVILVYNVLFSMQSGDRVEVEKHPIYSPIPCSQTQRNYFISQSGLRCYCYSTPLLLQSKQRFVFLQLGTITYGNSMDSICYYY